MSLNEIDIIKYAIEGDNAMKLYEIVVNLRTYKEFLDRIKLDYRNGVLIVTLVSYSDTDFYHFTDFTLPFIIGKADYELGYSIDLNSGKIADWGTNDTEGKYFVRPSKTQWEIALDIKCEQMKKDLPFN